MDAKTTERGNAIGTKLGILNNKNFNIKLKSKSLPANSEMNNQTVCRIKIRNKITNTEINVNAKDFKMYLSSIFTSN